MQLGRGVVETIFVRQRTPLCLSSALSSRALRAPPFPPQKSLRFGRAKTPPPPKRRRASTTMTTTQNATKHHFQFGETISISPKHVFYETPLSFAFVNLKPVVPGHVLVCPKRIVEKYEEMTTEEISDAMSVSQKVAVGACPFCCARSLDWMRRLVVVVVGIYFFASSSYFFSSCV